MKIFKRSPIMKKKVLIAMSGGVDSSVACLLLKKSGFECIGATIKTWPKEECGEEGSKMCCSFDSVGIAKNVASVIGIPHYVFDFSKEFRTIVRDYFDREYLLGRTPNPCIYCNSAIKFGALLNKADELDCDLVASGHFAQTAYDKKAKKYLLKKGKDSDKDQSYFLFRLSAEQRAAMLTPLGDQTKDQTRQIAERLGLASAERKESQDACFADQTTSFAELLRRRFDEPAQSGNIVDTLGRPLGRHQGIHLHTIGQRQGLAVALGRRAWVSRIDALNNEVELTTNPDDLLATGLTAVDVRWLVRPETLYCQVQIRYRAQPVGARVAPLPGGRAEITFDTAQRAVTPGQAVVFYDGDLVLGGGWIDSAVRGDHASEVPFD